MPKSENYDQISAELAERCNKREKEQLEAARAAIFEGLDESVNELKSQSRDKSLQAADRRKAAVEHLRLAGMYVEKHEHNVIKITELEVDV